MQNLFNTTRMFPEDWITPGGIGAIYRDAMDALYANFTVFQSLGDASLIFGVAALLTIPLVWVLARLNRV